MDDEVSHLTTGAAALLSETNERRIRTIRSRRWVLYPRAKQALDRLSALLDHPRGTRMPSVAIYGDSGMGKTMIMKRFRDEHPPSFNPLTGTLKTPVLAMEMTSRPGERRFYAELLTLLGARAHQRRSSRELGARVRCRGGVRMSENTPPRPLPVVLSRHSDELLSSWIGRHAAFDAVPPLVMLRHCLPEASSLRAADMQLTGDQEIRLANMFATEPAVMRRMTFANVARASRRLIATRPTQVCTNCCPGGAEPASILRSQHLGWRITCPLCGDQLRGPSKWEIPSPFQQYRSAALRGEKLLDDEAERGIGTWTSPTEIARLLLMRRIPRPFPREHDLWRFRVLGAIIPDLDHVVAEQGENLPTPAKPTLPLHMRPALLAEVAIVERAGPEMLQMLSGHMMGDNRVRFSDAAESMIARTRTWKVTSQMHLI